MDYLALLSEYREEMIEALQELIRIPSVAGPPVEDPREGYLPFGPEVHQCYQAMLSRGARDGFLIRNVDNYGGHIEFGGHGTEKPEESNLSGEIVGILGHLDVVPEGEDWDRDPFGGELIDGKIFGRGTSDDKGPVIAGYFAMKALKDIGFKPPRRVRLILGLDEETNWDGIRYYLEREEAPNLGFTPDADFPVIHGEKGILIFEVAKKFSKSTLKGLELRSLKGGNAANMVADHARALLRGEDYSKVREILEEYRKETGYRVLAKGIGKSLEITAHGKSAHGARPEQGLNAISILMEVLGRLPLVQEDLLEFIEFYNRHIGFELNGKSFGCSLSDTVSGHLVLNVGTMKVDPEAARMVINIRYPVTYTAEEVYQTFLPLLNRHDYGILRMKHQPPIYFPEDHTIVRTLMEVYREQTGDREARPLVIGGGTYARAADNIVAFGMTFPGEEELAHQKNECISVESLLKAAAIYAEAIHRLSGGDPADSFGCTASDSQSEENRTPPDIPQL